MVLGAAQPTANGALLDHPGGGREAAACGGRREDGRRPGGGGGWWTMRGGRERARRGWERREAVDPAAKVAQRGSGRRGEVGTTAAGGQRCGRIEREVARRGIFSPRSHGRGQGSGHGLGSPTLTSIGWELGWELDPQIFLRV
jgi:hypothetical protein